ncbi:MAG TPA: phospholipase C, phosphocholine-specific [Tepidisphaeraceae bacterium]|jgi:phospholipase C
MQSRREFLKTAAMLTGSIGFWGALEGPIARALAIEPEPGSSFLDAEHIVILMQENRSFDHAFGLLKGVRGYNDPRAITLGNGNPVWVQTNPAGESYAPFRLNLKDSKATWMGFLPHSWPSQVDARNHGKYDMWLEAKKSGHAEYAHMPLTMGHYSREDIPFYYSLADAFTICDQHFCSSITPTLPNRLYFMTGTVRNHQNAQSIPNVNNDQIEHNRWSSDWVTFPERLEAAGVPWKIYQNEIGLETGLGKEEEAWLSNFGCNVMEYFPQYNVGFSHGRQAYLDDQVQKLSAQIKNMTKGGDEMALSEEERMKLGICRSELEFYQREQKRWNPENYAKLTAEQKSLHEKAFCINNGDPAYRQLADLKYQDNGAEQTVQVPKGDVFHQFRKDVKEGKLPTVSWLVAPERLSDHPTSAWYGAWFISEAVRILTENPEVWKKTIFILTYDENDGYFDHVPPFVAPDPKRPETGFCSKGIDTRLEYAYLDENVKPHAKAARESPIGLGYRVPLIVASPWTRGGCVCSQVYDNTSILMFLETFVGAKTGKPIKESNITSWRRTVCGDLTSVFQSAADAKGNNPEFVDRDPFVEQIYQAKFKPLPTGYKALSKEDIDGIKQSPLSSESMSHQEPGVRRSSPLPYELYVGGSLSPDKSKFTIRMEAAKNRFADRAAGCPFTVYARTAKELVVRNYAVVAGDALEDSWAMGDFANGVYHIQVYGPNGFYREFMGGADDPVLDIRAALPGGVELQIANRDPQQTFSALIADRSYKNASQNHPIAPNGTAALLIDTRTSYQWYDFDLKVGDKPNFYRRFAGRVETGQWSYSDPAMGGVVG